jgi:hypothetical protein
MKTIKGNYGEVRFCDNMNETYGLPSLKDQSWDLCLTDPPYNVKLKGNSQKINDHPIQDKIEYEDNKTNEEYMDWNMKWFNELQRVSSLQIISTGHPNLKSWIEHTNPKDYLIHNKSDGQGLSSLCYLTKAEIFLMYGQDPYWNKHKQKIFPFNIITGLLHQGICKKDMFIHPCPKSYQFWKKVIFQSQMKSVIDPFLGSGTTAEVCEELGIPWLGYEIMEEYAPDIEKRIAHGIGKHKTYKTQLKLHQFIQGKKQNENN